MTDSVLRESRKPLLLYDGECGFCCKWVARWQEMGEGVMEFATSQSGAGEPFGFSAVEALGAVQLIEGAKEVHSGAAAVFRLMALCDEVVGRMFWGAYQRSAIFRAVTEWGYRFVADHRPFFSFLTALLWGADLRKPCYEKASRLFLRLLALTYAAAFGGLWWQVNGLIGPGGILPAGTFLDRVQSLLGSSAYTALPSLFWMSGCSAAALHVVCATGTLLSLGASLRSRWLMAPLFLILGILYLSLVNVGQIFMGYQWDALLLETGFLTIFLAPWSRRFLWPNFLSLVSRWLLVWLLFRLMVSSALVKWLSGDPAWHDLSALEYHFWTQPLPTPGGWLCGQLPNGILRCMTLGMFLIEGGAPWLLFGPRNLRLLGAGLIALLQMLISLTGNYGFFNLLALALCVLVVDDRSWPVFSFSAGKGKVLQDIVSAPPGTAAFKQGAFSPARVVVILGAAFLFLLTLLPMPLLPKPAFLVPSYDALAPYHCVNGYGLFAVMTRQRDEIIVEGSLDGLNWKPYQFRFKPGNLHHSPPWVPLLMPRLDWQMWFAALGSAEDNPWFESFMVRLFQADPAVLKLLAGDPFPGTAPRFLRARREEYRFATPRELSRDGLWWRSSPGGDYLPEVEFRAAEKQ